MPRAKKTKPEPQDAAAKLIEAYLRCFTSPEGEVVLADLKTTYQDRSSVANVDGVGFDINRTLVHEGCRLVYLKIVQMMEAGKDARATGEQPGTVTTDDDTD